MSGNEIPARVKDFCEQIEQTFNCFIEEWKTQLGDYEATLEPSGLFAVVDKYFESIDIYKVKHNLDTADRARRAAFACKWFVHFRPILCPSPEMANSHVYTHMLNEFFALYLAGTMLHIDFRESLHWKTTRQMIYRLRNGEIGVDGLSLFFYHLIHAAEDA